MGTRHHFHYYYQWGTVANMKSAFRSAICAALALSSRALNPIRHRHSLILLPRSAAVFPAKPSFFTSMASEGGSDAALSPTAHVLEKQFEEFRHQLDNSGSLCERIRSVALEIESATRLMHASVLLIHQSRPVPGAILLFTVLILNFSSS